jgi:hypothetical protein
MKVKRYERKLPQNNLKCFCQGIRKMNCCWLGVWYSITGKVRNYFLRHPTFTNLGSTLTAARLSGGKVIYGKKNTQLHLVRGGADIRKTFCLCVSVRLSPKKFSWSLILGTFTENLSRKITNLVKRGHFTWKPNLTLMFLTTLYRLKALSLSEMLSGC